jgi:hypothetical protein
MAIELDTPRAAGLPVANVREIGQTIKGMVIDKWVREQHDRSGNPIPKVDAQGRQINKRNGSPAYKMEEVLTIMVLAGTTGTITMGSGLDAEMVVPEVGSLVRLIFKGMSYNKLIEARNTAGGGTNVGDVINETAMSATIWRGAGDIAKANVTDPAVVAKARSQGLSIGMDLDVTYRRAMADEAGLVAQAEQHYHSRKAAITLDQKPAVDVDDAF